MKNDYDRMLDTALDQIESFTRGDRRYLKWFRLQSAANREALDRLQLRTLRESVSLPPAAFASLMAVAVATHLHLFTLWRLRDEMAGPVTLPLPPSLN